MKLRKNGDSQTTIHFSIAGQNKLKWAKRSVKYLWLILTFVILCFFLHTKYDMWIDSDMASELILARQLNKEGAILTTNWFYSTELRVLNTQLIFAPLFSVFNDWHMIRLAGTMILLGILLLSYYYFCRQAGLSRIYPWTAPILIMPLSYMYGYIMLIGAFYIPHVAISFAVLGLVFHILRSDIKWRRYLLLGTASVISLLAGMGGMRQLLIFYIPLFLCALILWCMKAFMSSEPPSPDGTYAWRTRLLVIVTIITCCAGAGYAINAKIFSQIYSYSLWNTVNFRNFSFDRLETLISGYLEALGYCGVGNIFSISLLYNAAGGLIVLTVIAAFAYLFAKRAELSCAEQFITMFPVCAIAVFTVFYLLTDMSFSIQYPIPVLILALPVAGVFFCKLPWRKYMKLAVCAMLAILISVSSFTYISQLGGNEALKSIADQLVSEGYYVGYGTLWNANVLTELADGQIEAYMMSGSGRTDELIDWLQLKEHFWKLPQGKVFVIFSQDELEGLPLARALEGKSEIFYQDSCYTVYTYDSYETLAELELSYFAGLPAAGQERKTDYPSAVGFFSNNAVLNENGELVSDGTEGYALYGPYSYSVSGMYNITLHYVVESGHGDGVFGVTLDGEICRQVLVTAEKNTVMLENVEIEGGRLFADYVFIPEGMVIRIQSIDYERVREPG